MLRLDLGRYCPVIWFVTYNSMEFGQKLPSCIHLVTSCIHLVNTKGVKTFDENSCEVFTECNTWLRRKGWNVPKSFLCHSPINTLFGEIFLFFYFTNWYCEILILLKWKYFLNMTCKLPNHSVLGTQSTAFTCKMANYLVRVSESVYRFEYLVFVN